MLKEIPYTVNDIAVSLAMTDKGLSNPKSTATLRDLCRRFLDQHKM